MRDLLCQDICSSDGPLLQTLIDRCGTWHRWVRRWRQAFLALAVGLTLLVIQPGLSNPLLPTVVMPSAQRVPLQQQPFYPELLAKRQHWLNAPIGRVVGDSPSETLLNFYAVTANASALINDLIQNHLHDRGLNWSSSVQKQITEIDTLLLEAEKALDLSAIPESRRAYEGRDRTYKLKVILDYLFSSQDQQLNLLDQQSFQDGKSQETSPNGEWSIGGTTVTLTPSGKSRSGYYRFSAETVKEIPRIYEEILPFRPSASEWFTPNLFSEIALTPGRIVPPKWYLMLPQHLRTNLLELSIDSNTLLQLSMALFVLLIYGFLAWALLKLFIKTYHDASSLISKGNTVDHWNQDQLSWQRFLILLPLLPLSIGTRWLINIEINITGSLATILQTSFEVLTSLNLALLGCLLLDAWGHSISELILRFRAREKSLISLLRAKSFVMPLCRAAAVIVVLAIVYRLLLNLGIPAATVLTFSAVPGLAIGLGASKLLSNFFAGLSIQSDRPLKLGEFCQVGSHQGFITRIGLRSLQIETLDSIVTIPNSVVDEQMVMNYSVRSKDPTSPARQKLEIRYQVKELLGAFATRGLLRVVENYMHAQPGLSNPIVSLDPNVNDSLMLICIAQADTLDWLPYLQIRQKLLVHLRWSVFQARKSVIELNLSYRTTTEQLRMLPKWIAEVFVDEPKARFSDVVFEEITEFSYKICIYYQSDCLSDQFEAELSRIHVALLELCAAKGLEIPYPTSIEIHRPEKLL